MNQPNQSSDNTFVKLGSSILPQNTMARKEGNILRNTNVSSVQFNTFSDTKKIDDEPVVNINRIEKNIESIEFICSCGKSKIVKFDYDEE